ncbi:MAG: GTPase ObgE, partial [Clostridia bacterium]|nr:GTPase ObgE [Clostridia bacterium]
EKYVAEGGPSGGDGGNGGSIIFEADKGETTLLPFRYHRKFVAKNGENGKGEKFHGKTAEDLILKVPEGTLIKDAKSGKIMYDMGSDGRFVAAKGGSGGWGNAHFATPTRQVPKFAKPGIQGVERVIILELKLLADVGLVGFPNVGKSTILSVVSGAKPKIANYHFTTLEPNLGVVDAGDAGGFVLADIPGIIEGAGEGVGLGFEFLRHVERTRLLLHVVDVSGIEGRNPIEDFDIINEEMKKFNPELSERPQIVVANKTDIITDNEMYENFCEEIKKRGYELFTISAAANKGVKELIKYVGGILKTLPIPEVTVYEDTFSNTVLSDDEITVRREKGAFIVEGKRVERIIDSTNFDDYESLQFFQRSLREIGVIDMLLKAGINEGDLVKLYEIEFEFIN